MSSQCILEPLGYAMNVVAQVTCTYAHTHWSKLSNDRTNYEVAVDVNVYGVLCTRCVVNIIYGVTYVSCCVSGRGLCLQYYGELNEQEWLHGWVGSLGFCGNVENKREPVREVTLVYPFPAAPVQFYF